MDRGGPRSSPYSVQTLDASSSNPIRAQPPRTSPEFTGSYNQIIQGHASRISDSAIPQQSFSPTAQLTSSGYELQTKTKNMDPYAPYDMNNMRELPPPAYHDIDKHPAKGKPRTDHEVVKLHEGGALEDHLQGFNDGLDGHNVELHEGDYLHLHSRWIPKVDLYQHTCTETRKMNNESTIQ